MNDERTGRGRGVRGRATAGTGRGDEGGSAEGEEARQDAPDGPEPEIFYCDLCGSVMLDLHCKLICEQCGYRRDCSDP